MPTHLLSLWLRSFPHRSTEIRYLCRSSRQLSRVIRLAITVPIVIARYQQEFEPPDPLLAAHVRLHSERAGAIAFSFEQTSRLIRSAVRPLPLKGLPVKDTSERPLPSLRVSVTDRCNLRGVYCMPEESTLCCLGRDG